MAIISKGSFPQLKFDKNSDAVVKEILRAVPEGLKSPEDLMYLISGYVRSKMSYDVLTVVFDKPGEERYADMIRTALSNPNAKFAISKQADGNLQTFVMNVMNNGRYGPREDAMLRELSIHGNDVSWLKEQVVKPEFRALMEKVVARNGGQLYQSEKGGILRVNEGASREVATMLDDVKVGVCRDFAMLVKRIYEKIAPGLFPNSEAVYVCNYEKRHSYVMLAFEDKNGKIQKIYFDPTFYITGNPTSRVREDGMHGNKRQEVWASAGNSEETGVA
ncbi:MAG: hypothetical protein QG650_1191 [Patescibacteria group bacterium]|nr:hypothetical protein [Patescibacteria group bacterium]